MAKPIASNAFCENAALVYGDKIWTIQPHPEFESPNIEGLIKYRGQAVPTKDRLSAATEALSRPNDNRKLAAQMAAFLKRDTV